MELAGDSGAEIDRKIKRYVEFAALIARGQTSADALRQMPEFASYFNSAGRIMDDRTVDFWRQQLNLNLAETYARVKAPVLILYTASDFITSQTCHEKIRDFLTTAGNKDVTLAVLQGLDHAYAQAADSKASYENYKSGRFIEHPAAKDHVIAWLKSH
jgi:alpha-beta hydrolase superfamily lysophospholipase